MNKKPSEILPPEVCNTFVPVLQAAKQSKETQIKLVELDFGSGPIVLKLVYVPLLNASGEVERILGITEDKTKEMFNERQLNMTAELVQVGGWRQQLPNRDVWMSKELLNMFGYPTDYRPNADELRGRFPDILELRKVIESSIAEKKPWDQEVRYLTLRDEQRWARYTGRPEFRDGKPYAIYGAMIDVTATKLIRNELALALQQAQRASQVKSEFLANMSHELRTPLTTIAGYVDLLMDSDFSPAEQREYFGRIKKSIAQTTRIIGDILDFERIEAQKFELSKEKGGAAWRGYFPVGQELTSGKPDIKEGVYFGQELDSDHPSVKRGVPLFGSNLFPAFMPEMRQCILDYMQAMTSLAHQLMQAVSLALNLPEDAFFRQYTVSVMSRHLDI